MRAVVANGKAATSFITRNLNLNGMRAEHASPEFESIVSDFENSGHTLHFETLREFYNQFFDDQPILVHNMFMSRYNIFQEAIEHGDVTLMFACREPFSMAYSQLISRTSTPGAPEPRVVEGPLVRKCIELFPDITDISNQLAYLTNCERNINLMGIAQLGSVPFIRYEDIINSDTKSEKAISEAFGSPFKFKHTGVVNKQTPDNYLSSMSSDIDERVIWLLDSIFEKKKVKESFSYFGYQESFAEVAARLS